LQFVQAPLDALYCPFGDAPQEAAPALEHTLEAQFLHQLDAVAPVLPLYLPATQFLHVRLHVWSAYLPVAQLLQLV
tara:strand:- start:58 stop:285 length:228 start_codon:yes stop_codon:yes gene_type:complete